MTTQQTLECHLALHVHTYGERAVIAALSTVLKLPVGEMEARLSAVGEMPTKKRDKPSGREPDVIDALLSQDPTKTQVLQNLVARYRNKTFLPELRDVRRFCERHGFPFGSTKSRTSALSKVVRLLVKLEHAELDSLLALPTSGEYSSLGVISDEILGHPGRP